MFLLYWVPMVFLLLSSIVGGYILVGNGHPIDKIYCLGFLILFSSFVPFINLIVSFMVLMAMFFTRINYLYDRIIAESL